MQGGLFILVCEPVCQNPDGNILGSKAWVAKVSLAGEGDSE